MASRRYIFVTLDMVEQHFTAKVAEFFRDYPDPLPDYQYLDGERGRGKLESALAEPRQTFGGQYLHRTIYDKAAALWRSATLNHPFIDGNKRMGFVCCLSFLSFNGYVVIAAQDEIVEACVAIAAGNPAPEVAELARWLQQNSISVDKLVRIGQIAGHDRFPAYWDLGVQVLNDLYGAED